MIQVQTWTDGSSNWNTREGGWGAVITVPSGAAKIVGAHCSNTTNNAMEAYAVLGVMYQLHKSCNIEVITDSQYVIYGINRINNPNKPLLGSNTDIWKYIEDCIKVNGHEVSTRKVKGHVGEPLNEIADRVAVYARKQMTIVEQTFENLDQLAIRSFMDDLANERL